MMMMMTMMMVMIIIIVMMMTLVMMILERMPIFASKVHSRGIWNVPNMFNILVRSKPGLQHIFHCYCTGIIILMFLLVLDSSDVMSVILFCKAHT